MEITSQACVIQPPTMVGNWSLVLRACLGSMVKQPFTVIPSEAEGVRVSIHHLLSVIARELMLTALVA